MDLKTSDLIVLALIAVLVLVAGGMCLSQVPAAALVSLVLPTVGMTFVLSAAVWVRLKGYHT